MHPKCHTRRKVGKEHRDRSLMERRRTTQGRSLARPHILLGEIDLARQAASSRT